MMQSAMRLYRLADCNMDGQRVARHGSGRPFIAGCALEERCLRMTTGQSAMGSAAEGIAGRGLGSDQLLYHGVNAPKTHFTH